uniref:uncharacterized protein LOC124049921 n=1 Tax=Scatophagus argus TaxID=75038 RepID=UPI001ED86334|nr:uncharacterized protein LOC124049921 [Scatophagus argus]
MSSPSSVPSTPPLCSSLSVTATQVRNQLRKLKARKAAGPDSISPKFLRSCTDQLCGIFQNMFNLSLSLARVQTPCLVPVPKTPHPKELNSYRPVALTSDLMKTLERLVLVYLCPLVSSSMGMLQFAYKPEVEDAIIYLLHTSLSHLERTGSTVRIMFFSSAFNTIQPTLLGDKLKCAEVDHHLSAWTVDYLTNRPQYVRTQNGTTPQPATYRSSQTTLRLSASPWTEMTASSENSSRDLWIGAWKTASKSTRVKPRSWWWTSAGANTPHPHW